MTFRRSQYLVSSDVGVVQHQGINAFSPSCPTLDDGQVVRASWQEEEVVAQGPRRTARFRPAGHHRSFRSRTRAPITGLQLHGKRQLLAERPRLDADWLVMNETRRFGVKLVHVQ